MESGMREGSNLVFKRFIVSLHGAQLTLATDASCVCRKVMVLEVAVGAAAVVMMGEERGCYGGTVG